MTSGPIRVVIIDDHSLIRRGVRMTLGDRDDIEVVGEGASRDEAIDLVRNLSPDLIFLDLSMPGGGFEAAEAIAASQPEVKIVIMTMFDDLASVQRSLKIGVAGFISKGADGDDLVTCVRKIARGERYISPELAVQLLEPGSPSNIPKSVPPIRVNLTKREQDFLALLGEGLSNAEIAVRTGLAETTVKQYVSALIQKLGVRNRTAAALLARASG